MTYTKIKFEIKRKPPPPERLMSKSEWQPIETAPYNEAVRVKVGSMTIIASLLPDASYSGLDTYCDQWVAQYEGEHPPCWSGGACWENNEDERMSLQPTAWQPLAPEPMIAALYVETNGCYFGLPDIDPWDEDRDARKYAGPWAVVAHPPCQRWGKLWAGQPLYIKRTGVRKVKGDDGGCFAAALNAVRQFGGVLEHPCGSHAWAHFGLNKPPREGGWIVADFHGGWTCCVEQGRYGHYARKPTWLYAVGCELPELDWGIGESRLDPSVIERMGLARAKRLGEVASRGGGTDSSPRIGTPPVFRDLLISIARSAGMSDHERN